VQHLGSAIMDLHMLFAGMFDFDSARDLQNILTLSKA
jgi:hypothetical protein